MVMQDNFLKIIYTHIYICVYYKQIMKCLHIYYLHTGT